VITVLPEPSHVKGVYSEILKSDLPQKHRVFIDSSTIDPSSSREVANWVVDAKQGQFVDAPMSGGVVGATAGTLTFMLGCPDNLVHTVEPILLRMGKRVLHCGAQGTGLSAKLANNYLLAINNIATAEAMNLGIRWGLEPKTLANIINVSTGRCWPSEVNNPAIMAAEEASAKLELGARAREVYEEAEKTESCRGRDFSVIYRFLGGKE
jgi:3-hydroxyisobutyrate/3-hydroxypropionate dehydrogenase